MQRFSLRQERDNFAILQRSSSGLRQLQYSEGVFAVYDLYGQPFLLIGLCTPVAVTP